MATVKITSHRDDDPVPSNGKIDVLGTAVPYMGVTTGCSVWCAIYTDQGAIEGIDNTPAHGADWGFHFDGIPTDVPVSIWAQATDAHDTVGTVSSTGYDFKRLNTAPSAKPHKSKKKIKA